MPGGQNARRLLFAGNLARRCGRFLATGLTRKTFNRNDHNHFMPCPTNLSAVNAGFMADINFIDSVEGVNLN